MHDAISIERDATDEAVIALVGQHPASKDPWRLSNIAQKAMEEVWTKRSMTFEENERLEGTCVGRPGAVVTWRGTHNGKTYRIWSCVAVDAERDLYLVFMYAIPTELAAGPVVLVQRIIDGVEIL